MINMGELFANDRIGDICMELVPMNEKELSTMLVEPGDLLFARQSLVLSGAGKCSIVQSANEPTTFESHIIRVRLNRQIADPAFYYYYFRSPICRIRSIVTQGVQAGIRANDLKKLIVHVPDIASQQRIASILSAYDDLIENNRRRIQLLEEAARLLYREWFVHLCFPGHEHVRIEDGVPEGWEKKRIGDLCSFTIGGGWGGEERGAKFTDPAFVIRGTDLPDVKHGAFDRVPFRFHEPKNLAKRALIPGDIILEVSNGNIRNIGRSHRVEREILEFFADKVMCASFCRLLRPVGECESLILTSHLDEMQKNGKMDFFKSPSAAGINNFRFKALLTDEFILIPKGALRVEVKTVFERLRRQQATLTVQVAKLIQARDLLLPRLMSGEVVI